MAEAVTDLFYVVSFLLGMNQVGFGKHRAPGGNVGPGMLIFQGMFTDFMRPMQVQAPGLLVQKTAGTGGTGGVITGPGIISALIKQA